MQSIRWYGGVVIATTVLIAFFALVFSANLSTEFSQNDFYDMSKTVLSVVATLFGLSAVAGGLLVVASARKEMEEMFLRSKILGFVAVSFLCFWFALLSGLMALTNPINRNAFVVSLGATVAGSLAGSVYLVYLFREFLLSHVRKENIKK